MTERSRPLSISKGENKTEVEQDLFSLESYSYELPERMIAQTPVEPRDSSKLLVLDRESGSITHTVFQNMISFLRPGDAIILNDTRVINARLSGRKPGSLSHLEIFLLKPVPESGETLWEVLVKPGRRAKPGQPVILDGGPEIIVMGAGEEGTRICSFPEGFNVRSFIERSGAIPLPPYIKNNSVDPERYQTIYAKNSGSVAAPTAGLHFTPSLLSKISELGIETGRITLTVGLGTFRPVKAPDIRNHKMHYEECFIPEETAALVKRVKSSGGRIFAVGTTVVRTIESRTKEDGSISPGLFSTDAFFYPGYKFRTVDAMITNFHLPRSSLLMLVSAFAGLDRTMSTYREAVSKNYRFYSFGDAMMIF